MSSSVSLATPLNKLSALDNIFVPLDGTARAESVLPYVERLYKKSSGQITLFHAVNPSIPVTSEAYSGLVSRTVHLVKDRAEEYLESVATGLRAKELNVNTKVVIGDPAQQILSTANRLGETMVALSGFSLNDRPNKSFGSIADYVLHYNRVPTLLVRPPDENMLETKSSTRSIPAASLETILVPLDGSTTAEKALDFSAGLAKRLSCKLKLIQVIPTRQQLFSQLSFDVSKNMSLAASFEQPLKNEGDEYLIKQVSRLRPHSLDISYEVSDGPIVDTIIKEAHMTEKPIIVFCTAGSKGAKYRWRMGSVARGLIRATDVPIIAIPHSYVPL